ncbi:hypothetical protein HJC23_005290 [Cyclotella cryptica]|uniref:Pyroglutamyl-peptidase I n=1 Tax=Cyclotella cryptica TaxID=29204 RepID=A0ABD3P4B1_9STRA
MSTAPRKCHFVITGFGPFHGVPVNPSMLLVSRLEKEADTLLTGMGIQITRTLIFETSAEAVLQEIDSLYGQIIGTSNPRGVHMDGCHVVFLHLGVNYRGKKFHLEQCAYNDATFRVPDERGYQPQGLCIIGDTGLVKEGIHEDSNSSACTPTKKETVHKFGKCFNTTLDLKEICSKLQENDNAQPVCVSNDPGRFVCNFTYCLSLDRCRLWAESSQRSIGTTPPKYHSLFVHVPPLGVIPEDDQFSFVIEIMKAIQSQLISPVD